MTLFPPTNHTYRMEGEGVRGVSQETSTEESKKIIFSTL
jgi:hypothetical protein